MKKPKYIQVLNPRTKHYVKIDTTLGKIVSHKKTEGAYKNITIRE